MSSDCRETNGQLTCNDKSVHFNHHEALISQKEWLATFIESRCHENSNGSHCLRSYGIVDIDGIFVWGVLQMGETSEYISMWHKVQATREIDVRLLPKCLKCVSRTIFW